MTKFIDLIKSLKKFCTLQWKILSRYDNWQESNRKTLRVPLPKFTLIGATTKAGELSGPLRDRFGIIHRLEFYTDEELAQVIKRTAGILEIEIDEKGALAIARRSR